MHLKWTHFRPDFDVDFRSKFCYWKNTSISTRNRRRNLVKLGRSKFSHTISTSISGRNSITHEQHWSQTWIESKISSRRRNINESLFDQASTSKSGRKFVEFHHSLKSSSKSGRYFWWTISDVEIYSRNRVEIGGNILTEFRSQIHSGQNLIVFFFLVSLVIDVKIRSESGRNRRKYFTKFRSRF